jgi:hypothetical protein
MTVSDKVDRTMVAPRVSLRAGKKSRKQQRRTLFGGFSAFSAGAFQLPATCAEALRGSPNRVYNAAIFDAVWWRGRMDQRHSCPMVSSHTNR